MKWFGFNLYQPVSAARATLVAVWLIGGSLALMSFKNGDKFGGTIIKDTTGVDKYGFSSLFTENFDPSKPYLTQLHPAAVPFVQEYVKQHSDRLEKMKDWGLPYFEMFEDILEQYQLPKELKYLSVIESNLKSYAVSHAGAVGPWQLMPSVARNYGLKVNRSRDERTDYYKSTHAAARIIKDLYEEFNDWLLVVAAYNSGSGRVKQAIKKSGSKNFWELQWHLPAETRNHVKKFIGTHYIFEGAGGLTTMTARETKEHFNKVLSITQGANAYLSAEEIAASDVVEISGRYNSVIVANNLLMDIDQFNKWNPEFDKKLAEGEKYLLRLPKDRINIFKARKGNILLESVRLLLSEVSAAK